MAINFKEVKEIEPWEKFAEDFDPNINIEIKVSQDMLTAVAKNYHEWLEKKNPEIGACILCERRFKPRKNEA